jgi:peptidoglycan/LPS O-acetylase OafA/YrhL
MRTFGPGLLPDPTFKGRIMTDSSRADGATGATGLWRRIRRIHPGLVLAALDLIGLGIASYLSFEELQGKPPWCPKGGVFGGCVEVANSQYTRPFAGIPVAVYGVILSITLFVPGHLLVAHRQLQAPPGTLRPVPGRRCLSRAGSSSPRSS